MQIASSYARRAAPVSWLGTAALFGFIIATLAAFALLGVDESRAVLIG